MLFFFGCEYEESIGLSVGKCARGGSGFDLGKLEVDEECMGLEGMSIFRGFVIAKSYRVIDWIERISSKY